jgi:DHA3 family macrolide efflux protein-like MFS transporter
MLVQFGLVWWLTRTTGSATVLATSTLAAVLPSIFLGPVAGTLVDRWNRRLVMIIADSLIALATVALILLYAAGAMQVWHVYAILAFRSAMGGFHWPAMQASTTLMVPESQLTRVAGLNQTLFGVMNIISPPLGALLLGLLPFEGLLAIDVFTAMLAVVPLLFIYVPQPVRVEQEAAAEGAGAPGRSTVWMELRIGLRYVWGWPGLLAVLVLAMLVNFVVTPAFSLMPILITKHFGGAAPELGWLESAWGIGVVGGAVVLSAWGGFRRKVVTSLTGLIGMGLGLSIVGLAPATLFGMALAGMCFSGFMNPICNGPFNAVLQSSVRPDMQGRVLSLVQSGSSAMVPLSLLVAGPVADALGVRVWYLLGGIVTVIAGVVAFSVPDIVHLEHNGHATLPTREEPPAVPAMEVAPE